MTSAEPMEADKAREALRAIAAAGVLVLIAHLLCVGLPIAFIVRRLEVVPRARSG